MSDGLKDRVRALPDLATVEAVYDPELRSWAPPSDQPLGGRAALAAFRALRGAFPDFHDIEDLFSAEDRVQLAMLGQLGALGG